MLTEERRSGGRAVIGVGTLNISARARTLILEVLNSNRLSYGPMTMRFESEFARLHGCSFGVMSNSGTSALQIALQALKELHGWADGDEVIVPALTFVATPNIVLHNRMTPVLVDVDARYYEIDPAGIESKITPRTRAIIPVHLLGQPADMSPIRDIAARYDLKIIEDSAETMFAAYEGKPVGSLGDVGCFSTYAAHLLVTGVGGLNTTNDPDIAIRLRSLMNHGRDSIYLSIDDDEGKSDEELRMIVARRFQFTSIGHSFRVTEMEAALGLAQLEDWESIVGARRANARSLTARLSGLEDCLQLPQTRPGSEHSFMMYPIVLRDRPKTDVVNFLEQYGVETRDMLPLTNQPVYHRLLGWREDDHPVARWINHGGFYVGCHQDLTEGDLDYMSELLERHFRRRPSAVRQGACLVLTTSNSRTPAERAVQEIPWDLFEQVIVVDAGSIDGTLELLSTVGLPVTSVQGTDALAMAAEGNLPIEHDSVVFFSLDGRHNPSDVGKLLLALEHGHDMVIASRFLHGGARHDRSHRIRYRSTGNRVFTLMANLLFYGNFSDSLCSFRAVRRRRLAEAALSERGATGFYELSIRGMQRAWKVAEVPTVEMVNPAVDDRKRVILSVWPLVRLLLREWLASRGRAA